MKQRQNTYQKAVSQFLDLTSAVKTVATDKPRKLASVCNIPPSTGYRIVGTLEKSGVLERDATSTLVAGATARRIGFSAFGFGQFADISAPILLGLRQEVQLTSFVGFCIHSVLHPGIFSLGRGVDFAIPSHNAQYRLGKQTQIENAVVASVYAESASKNRQEPTLVAFLPLAGTPDASQAVIGLFQTTGDVGWREEKLAALRRAQQRLLSAARLHAR